MIGAEIKTGSVWRHKNGAGPYHVVDVANIGGSAVHAPSVVYRGGEKKSAMWVKTIIEFVEKMVPETADTKHDGKGDQWFTPPHIVDAVTEAMGRFDLDPCAHPGTAAWDASDWRICALHGGDGLKSQWVGSVFCNPPYSRPAPWLKRCAEHASNGNDVIALVPAAVATCYWGEHVWRRGATVVQPVGRLSFASLDGTIHGGARVTTCFVTWDRSLAKSLARELRARDVACHIIGVVSS